MVKTQKVGVLIGTHIQTAQPRKLVICTVTYAHLSAIFADLAVRRRLGVGI
jgi:hypothetical protein